MDRFLEICKQVIDTILGKQEEKKVAKPKRKYRRRRAKKS